MGENFQFYYYIQPETMETYIKIIQTVQSHSAHLALPPQLTDVELLVHLQLVTSAPVDACTQLTPHVGPLCAPLPPKGNPLPHGQSS